MWNKKKVYVIERSRKGEGEKWGRKKVKTKEKINNRQ